jgi:hypothetical protein
MQKKVKYVESSFVARSMISPVSTEDTEIKMMSVVFSSILGHDDFIEFNMSPLPRKKKHIRDMHALSVTNMSGTGSGLNATEKRVQNFIGYINDMEDTEQEFFLTKLDRITKDAENHVHSVNNSPTMAHVEKRSNKLIPGVSESLIIKLNKVKEDATFKNTHLSYNDNDSEDIQKCEPVKKNEVSDDLTSH